MERINATLAVECTGFRHRLEASTGIYGSAFFHEEAFRPLAVAAILKEFPEGLEAAKFETGFRYFFGHRISG